MHWGGRCCEDHVPVALGQAKQASAKAASDGGVTRWTSTTGGGQPTMNGEQRRCSTATAAKASDGARRLRPVTCSNDNSRWRTKEGNRGDAVPEKRGRDGTDALRLRRLGAATNGGENRGDFRDAHQWRATTPRVTTTTAAWAGHAGRRHRT
ncbi:hypothetical protein E2562_023026 [Oryza meyeriana var. granulata]|uniref:Uncharacterized protein n=1 Tax=Oryza meyeriana var. granulata TaxID=110450 RepID=A0A6G1EYF7_9ORYZ|nr:hypothetical protein E2562_023026 [Oryza meyeriana var. granulata]